MIKSMNKKVLRSRLSGRVISIVTLAVLVTGGTSLIPPTTLAQQCQNIDQNQVRIEGKNGPFRSAGNATSGLPIMVANGLQPGDSVRLAIAGEVSLDASGRQWRTADSVLIGQFTNNQNRGGNPDYEVIQDVGPVADGTTLTVPANANQLYLHVRDVVDNNYTNNGLAFLAYSVITRCQATTPTPTVTPKPTFFPKYKPWSPSNWWLGSASTKSQTTRFFTNPWSSTQSWW